MTDPPDIDSGGALSHLRTARGQIFREYAEVESALDVLRARRHSLATALEQLNQLIDQLGGPADGGYDAAIVAPGGSYAVAVEVRRSNTFDASEGSTREAILHVLASEPRVFETHEIVDGVQELGVNSQAATTRSLLSKMAEAKQVERVRRGLYREARVHSRDGRLVKANSRTPYHVVEKPTADEFMTMAAHPDDLPAEPGEPTQMNFEVEQAHLEDQADREEISS